MLLSEDLQSQLRGELAVVELTTVSIPDLLLALGDQADTAAMTRWLCERVPAGTTVECDVLQQQFALRRGQRRPSAPGGL